MPAPHEGKLRPWQVASLMDLRLGIFVPGATGEVSTFEQIVAAQHGGPRARGSPGQPLPCQGRPSGAAASAPGRNLDRGATELVDQPAEAAIAESPPTMIVSIPALTRVVWSSAALFA